MIVFRECLVNGIMPIIIEDKERMDYIQGLSEYQNKKRLEKLIQVFEKEQAVYTELVKKFIIM